MKKSHKKIEHHKKRRTTGCMKHKKKDKVGKKDDKVYADSGSVSQQKKRNGLGDNTEQSKERCPYKTPLPKNPEEFSCNWKQFLKAQNMLSKPVNRKREAEKWTSKMEKRKAKSVEKETVPVSKEFSSKKADVWFDDVDEVLLDAANTVLPSKTDLKQSAITESKDEDQNRLVKPQSFTGLTQHVSMDCEMVGVGEDGKESILARVSIVNHFGQCIYDKFVQATEEVTDYRTHVSGVTCADMDAGDEFSIVQKKVHDIINGRILIGHALSNDLKVLFLSHPWRKIRDTSRYRPFRKLFSGRTPSLKKLSEKLLGVEVQSGQHSSVQDAQAAMRLYTMYRKQWEKEIKAKRKRRPKQKEKKNTEDSGSNSEDMADS